jgi:hypothetical protein
MKKKSEQLLNMQYTVRYKNRGVSFDSEDNKSVHIPVTIVNKALPFRH